MSELPIQPRLPTIGIDPPSAEKGKKLFKQKCATCHTHKKDGEHHKNGPNLFGIIGTKPASRTGYDYSEAIKNSCTSWDETTLSKFLKGKSRKNIPGTKMWFKGLKTKQERADLIEFLKTNKGKNDL